jgi:predicted small lipoprotein YifL
MAILAMLARAAVAVLAAALLAAVAGCGQRGPLYLRDSPPPGIKAPKPQPYQPVPYPKPAAEDEAPGRK